MNALHQQLQWVFSSRSLCVRIGCLLLAGMFSASAQCNDSAGNTAALQNEPIVPLTNTTVSVDAPKVALGERLFHDPRLSGNGNMACATCHPLSKGGTDGKSHKVALSDSGSVLTLNTPSVLNAALYFRSGWLGSEASLADQVDRMVSDTFVLNSTWDGIVRRIAQDSAYITGFQAIYDDVPSVDRVREVLVVFLNSLAAPASRFDRFLNGDADALTAEEKAGYSEFKAHGCIACHQGMMVGGNMFQRFGVFENYFVRRNPRQTADEGRLLITGRERDRHVFRVPSLRNVALTAPYFHDGSVATLEEAVKVMARYQLGQIPDGNDIKLISAFLRTLTGKYPAR